jgi:hypothetical protein
LMPSARFDAGELAVPRPSRIVHRSGRGFEGPASEYPANATTARWAGLEELPMESVVPPQPNFSGIANEFSASDSA